MTPVAYLEAGVLYCEDNLKQLSQFPSECVDLIYLDRVIEMHRVLKPAGSLYLHCDSTASHYLKLMLDLRRGI